MTLVPNPLRMGLALLLAAVGALGAEWRVRYTDDFRAMMQRVGHPVPEYVGSFATEADCRAAIRRAESADPSLRGRMEAVQVSREPSPSPGAAPRTPQPSYETVLAEHKRIVVEAQRSGTQAPRLAPLTQLQVVAHLSLLASRAKGAEHPEFARRLGELAFQHRQGCDRAMADPPPGVPLPTPVQQAFFDYVAQESAAAVETLLRLRRQYGQTHERFAQAVAKVDQAKARLQKVHSEAPPAPAAAPASPAPAVDPLVAEAQALLAAAQGQQKEALTELAALSRGMTRQEEELRDLSQALESVAARPDRAEAVLKGLQGGKP